MVRGAADHEGHGQGRAGDEAADVSAVGDAAAVAAEQPRPLMIWNRNQMPTAT